MLMHPLLISVYILVPLFLIGWWVQERQKNAGWVDVIWAFGVAAAGLAYCVFGAGNEPLRTLVGFLYVLWFGRLGLHLAIRIAQHAEEDGRYAHMRTWAGSRASVLFLFFYLLQASWVWLFTLPAWVLAQGQWPELHWVVLAVFIVIVSWLGETLADKQLSNFKRDPSNRGKTCRTGLWRYSRHPNYFFEWCHWFAYPLLAMATPYGEWLWLAPIMMFVFLYFMTGIPFTEQQAIRSRGDDYRQYQRTTSMFFPWKPKKEGG